MASQDSAIRSKLLGLLKEYRLERTPDGLEESFIAGPQPRSSGLGITWWRSPRSVRLLRELAIMLVERADMPGLDVDTATETVEKVLREHALNGALFKSVFGGRSQTLFDAKACSPPLLADRLIVYVDRGIAKSLSNWLVIVAASRIRLTSRPQDFDGVSLVSSEDENTWRDLAKEFASLNDWSPRTGLIHDKPPRVFGDKPPSTWLVCKASGTANSALRQAREHMQVFIAVLLANEYRNQPFVATHSAATPSRYCVLFASSGTSSILARSIGSLIPPLGMEIVVGDPLLGGLSKWYGRRRNSDARVVGRITVGAQFLHHALMSQGIERFMHSYISLDALFGERHSVEQSVLKRVRALGLPLRDIGGRLNKLYDLRNEILHGGSSTVEAWSGHEPYIRHFESKPINDALAIALLALLQPRSFEHLKPGRPRWRLFCRK